jgi:hypothetical protein
MTPEARRYVLAVPRRPRMYVLLLRILSALITLAVLVGYALGDRVVPWLTRQSTAFVIVLGCAVFGLLVWADVITGNWAQEKAVYVRVLRRFGSWLRRDG